MKRAIAKTERKSATKPTQVLDSTGRKLADTKTTKIPSKAGRRSTDNVRQAENRNQLVRKFTRPVKSAKRREPDSDDEEDSDGMVHCVKCNAECCPEDRDCSTCCKCQRIICVDCSTDADLADEQVQEERELLRTTQTTLIFYCKGCRDFVCTQCQPEFARNKETDGCFCLRECCLRGFDAWKSAGFAREVTPPVLLKKSKPADPTALRKMQMFAQLVSKTRGSQ